MEETIAYLDNAATTRVCDPAAKAALRMMQECYGNPSSLHHMGAGAARELSAAREAVAELMGCQSECICFTSGGTEANHLAIIGGAHNKVRRGKHLVTTAVEHASVAGAMAQLEQAGWTVTRISPDSHGNIDPHTVADAVTSQTTLVSMMLVNNETGAILPVEETATLIRRKNPQTLIHCDGVQAFGKLPLKVSRMDIDMMSISGHKIGAPKGIGALYLRRGIRLSPLLHGSQERGLRGGTEPMPQIAALGAAAKQLTGQVKSHYHRMAELRETLLQNLQKLQDICINSPHNASPYIVNVSVLGYRSETMLHFLESRGVFVSSGSACSKGATSPVLQAMGLSPAQIDSALRISMTYETTATQLEQLVDALQAGQQMVVKK